MADLHKWYQKFFDQCSFAPQYTLQLTPGQTTEALRELESRLKKGWRIKSLIRNLKQASLYPTLVGNQRIVTITVDSSDTITLRDILHLTKASCVYQTEDTGFWSTTTRRGLNSKDGRLT